jgi:flagellar M-ring protein FliF
MNFQQVEETVEQYDPQGSVVRSSQKQEEHQPTPTHERGVGGIPGARTTQPVPTASAPPVPATTVPDDTNAASKNLLKQNETINYEVSKAIRHIVNPTGKVEKVSIAVIIDNHTKVTTDKDGKPQTSTEPRTPEEMKKYRDLVTAAIGLNTDRGDQLTVENISFEGDMADFVEQPTFMEKQGPMIMTALRYTIIPVVFIVLYLFFLRPVQKTVFSNWATVSAGAPRMVPRLPGDVQTPMTVKQLEAQLRGGALSQDAYANTPEREFLPLPSPTKMDMIRKRVVEHASQDPETVARLVRIWLNDERNK